MPFNNTVAVADSYGSINLFKDSVIFSYIAKVLQLLTTLKCRNLKKLDARETGCRFYLCSLSQDT